MFSIFNSCRLARAETPNSFPHKTSSETEEQDFDPCSNLDSALLNCVTS